MIKATDTGNEVCLLQHEDYISEGIRQLSDTKFYQQVDSNLIDQHRKEVQTLITKMYTDEETGDSVFLYLQGKECRTF